MFEIEVPVEQRRRFDDGIGDLRSSTRSSQQRRPHRLARDWKPAIKGSAGTAIFEPFVSAGTMLRDWYLQGQVKVELPVDRAKADRAFVYNAYLGRDTSLAPTTWTLGVELNGENHEVSLTPQVRKGLTGTGALAASVGAMVPLNEREERGVRWVGYLLWEYLEPWRARK